MSDLYWILTLGDLATKTIRTKVVETLCNEE